MGYMCVCMLISLDSKHPHKGSSVYNTMVILCSFGASVGDDYLSFPFLIATFIFQRTCNINKRDEIN